MKISHNGRRLEIPVKKVSEIGKIIGLMFKSRETESLLFENSFDSKWAIHSFFVFFDFLAVWLDSDDKVLEIRKVRPFTFHVFPKKEFRKLIEIPINSKNNKIAGFLVGERKV